MNLSIEEISLFKQIVEATVVGTAVYTLPGNVFHLAQAGFVEGNPAMVDPVSGGFAYRATQAGISFYQANYEVKAPVVAQAENIAPAVNFAPSLTTETVAVPVPPATSNGALLRGKGFKLPGKVNRRASGAVRDYGFESMELGDFIFIPNTEERPDAKKSLTSTISSANKRFATHNPRRVFISVRATAGQVFCDGAVVAPSDGCFVVRVEPPIA